MAPITWPITVQANSIDKIINLMGHHRGNYHNPVHFHHSSNCSNSSRDHYSRCNSHKFSNNKCNNSISNSKLAATCRPSNIIHSNKSSSIKCSLRTNNTTISSSSSNKYLVLTEKATTTKITNSSQCLCRNNNKDPKDSTIWIWTKTFSTTIIITTTTNHKTNTTNCHNKNRWIKWIK